MTRASSTTASDSARDRATATTSASGRTRDRDGRRIGRTTPRGAIASALFGTKPALWCCIAFALAQMLCGAPFAWFGKDAGQRFFNAENATREFFSMSMWCTVMHFREVLETLMVIRWGDEAVRMKWVHRAAVANYLRIGLLMFEGAQGRGQGRGNATLVDFYRQSSLMISFGLAVVYAVTTSSGIPRVRPFYKPRNTAHTVMLFNWVLLALYGATFAFGDPVLLYYFKVGTRFEYAMVNHLAIGILSCIIGLAVAMASFPPNLQAKYCLLHGAVIEPLCMGVMFWQENAYTLLRDGIVDRQWCNHLFIKMTLAMPWMYGYLACRDSLSNSRSKSKTR